MAASLDLPTPTSEQLKELFQPFDACFNKKRFHLSIPDCSIFRHASVLIPLFYKDGEIHVLLTVRNKNMQSHAGQVAFPGGMSESGDANAIATALRETEEEVGKQPQNVDIVAVLSPLVVRPNTLVTPVVGIVSSDFRVQVNQREVDTVFDLPLKRFLSLEGRTQENLQYDENLYFIVYHFQDTVNGRVLDTWGFTTLLCIQVAIVAFQSDLKICFHENAVVTKENCFNTRLTQATIDTLCAAAKL